MSQSGGSPFSEERGDTSRETWRLRGWCIRELQWLARWHATAFLECRAMLYLILCGVLGCEAG